MSMFVMLRSPSLNGDTLFRSACDADRTQHEDTQAQLHLLLEKYRQRIKSLEYDLQLEKGLHETTRRSLESLRRDHSKFRSQVFSPHKEG